MESLSYTIDGKRYVVNIEDSPSFDCGKQECLSDRKSDVTYGQKWYKKGYKANSFINAHEFSDLLSGLTSSVEKIIKSELNIEVDNFKLENYHQLVTTDEDHIKVVSKTRDLFPSDFNFPIEEMIIKFEDILGFKLTDINPYNNKRLHIIVRINRPESNDFNPPHKDIYEAFDGSGYIPQFLNLWIPICGVNGFSSLPVAPESHLIPENEIIRTFEGGVVEGKKYRVRMIKEWAGSSKLIRADVKQGEVLFFSSHLIHGLAVNDQKDKTRVALEFRLFKKD